MKNYLLSLILGLCICLNIFSQAKSLTVDCQTPGWLSSLINYSDQQTLENLKVTGYINGTDIQFLYDLNYYRSLTGVIDLEDVSIVSGGTFYTNGNKRTIEKDNEMPSSFFHDQKKHIQKFIYPKTLIKGPISSFSGGLVDSIIWTSTKVKSLASNSLGNCKYLYLPEGIETIINIRDNIRINLPNSIKEVGFIARNLIVYSYITNPETVKAEYEEYSGGYNPSYSYWAAICNSKIYIPKGTMEKYLQSDFATLNAYKYDNSFNYNLKSGNIFIEYYDIDSTKVAPSVTLYKGDTLSLVVKIYPDDNLVSWIDYVSNSTDIASIDNNGVITANNFGRTEILATPHVFIDGLQTKTGTCVVNVISHVEGIELQKEMSLHIGETKELNAKTLPLNITDNMITYTSNNTDIAEVNNYGIVVGKSRGSCVITATSVDGDYTASCEVTVMQPVEALIIEKHKTTLKVGETEKLFTQISPATADDKEIQWETSNELIATVDNFGYVTAIKAGEIWIKAISHDNVEAKDSCQLIVIQPVTGITLSQTSTQMSQIGEIAQLEAIVLPEDASNKEVRWTSTNEAVCAVSQGTVIATGYGTSVVLASTVDGGFLASCVVKVEDTSAIRETIADTQDDYPIYDLMGCKVEKVIKGGLYIQNGKKFITR